MQKFIVYITTEDMSYLENKNFECFILSSKLSSDFKKSFKLKAREKIVLGENINDCLDFNLDGVILDFSSSKNISSDWKAIKSSLQNKITGIITRNRRHEAMLVSECEPDFIIFKAWKDGSENTKILTSWYQEMFLIQSALFVQESLDYQDFETDFVIISDTML